MPRICFFNGIKIYVYYNDHAPPHIHVNYDDEWVVLVIKDGSIYSGYIHPHTLALVRQWMAQRKVELMEAWNAAATGKKPKKVSAPSTRRGRS